MYRILSFIYCQGREQKKPLEHMKQKQKLPDI
jgi:hypothetical protein